MRSNLPILPTTISSSNGNGRKRASKPYELFIIILAILFLFILYASLISPNTSDIQTLDTSVSESNAFGIINNENNGKAKNLDIFKENEEPEFCDAREIEKKGCGDESSSNSSNIDTEE
ncbi:hypothetical protein CYY_008638 [Polysphondylium violaceum]|uniref:Uncharacterized protein n=1 Tax=Polysphondylium violaceum TaxID=133409 RepID=A0A8J4PN63_9MYCE|nr:hypothetical protein CYY_008638 [Polysphondylium violaceum]